MKQARAFGVGRGGRHAKPDGPRLPGARRTPASGCLGGCRPTLTASACSTASPTPTRRPPRRQAAQRHPEAPESAVLSRPERPRQRWPAAGAAASHAVADARSARPEPSSARRASPAPNGSDDPQQKEKEPCPRPLQIHLERRKPVSPLAHGARKRQRPAYDAKLAFLGGTLDTLAPDVVALQEVGQPTGAHRPPKRARKQLPRARGHPG